MLVPLTGHLVIEPIVEEEKTKSGIVLPETSEKEDPKKGKIIALGKLFNRAGKEIKPEVKKGDIVVHDAYAREIKEGSKEYQIIKYEDILAKII